MSKDQKLDAFLGRTQQCSATASVSLDFSEEAIFGLVSGGAFSSSHSFSTFSFYSAESRPPSNKRSKGVYLPVPRHLMELVAVSSQGFTNFLGGGFDDRSGSAKVPRLFLAQVRGKVAGACPAMLCLSLGGQPETLLRALVSLLFRH